MHQSAAEEAIALLASERAVGPGAFDVVARALTVGLQCRCAGVARLAADDDSLALLASRADGREAPLSGYPIAGSACADIYRHYEPGIPCRHSGKLARRFPHDPTLSPDGSNYYCAAGVYNEEGDAVGHIFVVNDEEVPDDAACRLLFQLAGQCVGAELSRQQAATALSHSDERYRRLVETTNAIAWELDYSTWQFTYVSPQAEDVLGYPLADWYAKDFWPRHVHPDDLDEAVNFCVTLSEQQKDHDLEYRMIAADGRTVWIRDIVTVHSDARGPNLLGGYMIDITAQMESELALVQSERRFKDFAEAASEWFWEMDENLRFSYFSERAYQTPCFRPELLLGMTRRELIEANDAVFGHGTTRQDWERHLADLDAHRPFHDFRHPRPNPDGGMFYLSVSGKPIFDGSGQFQGYRGVATNITEEVVAETARKESDLRFRDFAESASDWFWEMDENLRFSYFSEGTFESTGARPEQLLGKTRREILAEDDTIVGGDTTNDAWEWHLADLEAHRPFHDFRHPRLNPAGGLYYVSISGRPVFDSAGNFKGYRGSGSNITKQVLTEAAFRKSEQRFRDFAEAATDWFWEMDENLRFSGFSERYYQATGVQPGEVIGLTRRELLERNPALVDDVATEQDWERHIADIEAHRPVHDFRHSRPKPTGEILYVSISAKPVFDEGGAFRGYRGSGTNITNQMRTEMALRESEAQLRLQSERAEEASRAKSEFLANMSHEIRTPLNAVLGFSDSMRNEILGPLGSEKYAEYASAIHASGLHLLDLVNDILDLAKIESGTFSLSRDAFDLREIFDECLQMTRETANRKEISLTVEADDERIPVIADLRAMKQILLNLLSNALKYTESGGSVVLAAQADDDGLTLSVRDTGIGIAESDVSMLTEAFVQGRTDEAYLTNEGTGLGLAITDSLVKLHGGSLTIDSVVGEGTTVSIRLPSEILDQSADLSIAG